jgi:predicted nucleic-acid-binding Zn-ribbon protein
MTLLLNSAVTIDMPDIKIFCENCGFDRFTAPTAPPYAQSVSHLVCKKCGYAVDANKVVVFSDITMLSQTHSEAFLEARPES